MEGYVQFIGENLDRLCALEMRPQGPNQGVIWNLYRAARDLYGEPLSTLAARRLSESVHEGDTVIVTTGAGHPVFLPWGETDGPLGAAALARILRETLGAVPLLLTEAQCVENLAATCLAAGMGRRDYVTARKVPFSCAIEAFPADASAHAVASEVLDRCRPAAVIACEKLGPNEVGVAHTSTGLPAGDDRGRLEHLFDEAAARGILTIGIGDNGNEIGMGAIREAVWEHKPYGRECRCPCGQGLATRVATDVIVVAGTSNWGAYGIEGALAALVGKPDVIHDVRTEARMLEACVDTGGVDGSTGRHWLQVDGTPADVQSSIMSLIRTIVANGSLPPRNRPF